MFRSLVVGRPTQPIYISDIYQHRNTNMNDKDHLVGQLTRSLVDPMYVNIYFTVRVQ